MKKIITAILAVLYFAVSSGMVFNIHYCKNKVSSVQIDLLAKDLCGCSKKGKKTAKKNCCKTEHKIIKLATDYKISTTNYTIHAPVEVLDTNHFSFNVTSTKVDVFQQANNHIPPLISFQDTYLKNCTFRI
jgi:undecaprenyl pyrophosphate synthase